MPVNRNVLKLFVASPSDVDHERLLVGVVVDELNRAWSDALGMSIDVIKWETHTRPAGGPDPQEAINAQISNDYDIFLGILWSRFGTPTPRADSGTQEEFERAFNRYTQNRQSISIMVYFKSHDLPYDLNVDQFRRVREFQQRLKGQGVLYSTFQRDDDFQAQLRFHLAKEMQEWASRPNNRLLTPGSGPEHEHESGNSPASYPAKYTDLQDFIDRFTNHYQQLSEAVTQVSKVVNTFGGRIAERSRQLNQAWIEGGRYSPHYLRTIDQAQLDTEQFGEDLRLLLPYLSSAYDRVLNSSQHLAIMFTGTNETSERLRYDTLTSMQTLKHALEHAVLGMTSLRDRLLRVPAITTAYDTARQQSVHVLNDVIDVLARARDFAGAIVDLLHPPG